VNSSDSRYNSRKDFAVNDVGDGIVDENGGGLVKMRGESSI
jgi:hypothetical protein